MAGSSACVTCEVNGRTYPLDDRPDSAELIQVRHEDEARAVEARALYEGK